MGNQIAFPAPSSVPIIGQPTVLGCLFVAHILCACEAKTPMMVVFGSAQPCPACRRAWSVNANPQTGQPQVVLLGQAQDGNSSRN